MHERNRQTPSRTFSHRTAARAALCNIARVQSREKTDSTIGMFGCNLLRTDVGSVCNVYRKLSLVHRARLEAVGFTHTCSRAQRKSTNFDNNYWWTAARPATRTSRSLEMYGIKNYQAIIYPQLKYLNTTIGVSCRILLNNNKLTYRREAARWSTLLEILLLTTQGNSRSFDVTPSSRACVTSY